MEFNTAIQILSYGVLTAAGTALIADFVKARRQLSRAFEQWRPERDQVQR